MKSSFYFVFFGDLDLADFQNKFETSNSNTDIYNKAIEILMKHEKSSRGVGKKYFLTKTKATVFVFNY